MASQYNTIRKDLEEYFESNWPTTPIDFANARFTQPKGEFTRFRVVFGDSDQISMGDTPDHRAQLLITISLFGKENTGTGQLLGYADTIVDLFTNKTIGVVNTRSPGLDDRGVVSGHYQINILVPAWSDRN